jgi:hypothetical protein
MAILVRKKIEQKTVSEKGSTGRGWETAERDGALERA